MSDQGSSNTCNTTVIACTPVMNERVVSLLWQTSLGKLSSSAAYQVSICCCSSCSMCSTY
jgi:hypothetical protein